MKVIVSFSGGKDSQACLIQACKEFGAKNIEAVFCDTGWEHNLTYLHVKNVTESLGVRLIILKSKIGGFEDLCKRMKWFPDTAHRMCNPASLFAKGKIPARFCRKYGKGIPAFEDVIAYVSRDDAQLDMFEPEEGYSCMSIYHGLCE